MPGKKAEAKVYVLGDARGFHAAMKRAQWSAMSFQQKMMAIGGQMKKTGRTLTRNLTVPLLAVGAVSVKLAADFESSATKIEALAGAGGKEVKFLRKEVLALAPAVGIGPKELMDALYPIESMGLRGAKAMSVLDAASKAAAAGLGDLTTVSDAVTSALNAYQGTGLKAAHAVDIMVASVKAGKMKSEDFAGALGNVLPLASKLGVSFDQVGAAIASMSRMGMDPHGAGAALTQMLTNMLKPTSAGAKTLDKLGLSYAGIRKEIAEKGLMPAMKHLSAALGGNAEAAATILSKKGLTAFFTLTGKAAKSNEKIFADVAKSTGLLDKAFETTSKDSAFKLKQAFSALKAAGITIGAVLLPIVVSIAKAVGGLAERFGKLSPRTQKFILIGAGVAAALGPVLIILGHLIAILPILGAIIAAVTSPITIWIVAIIAAVAALVILYRKSETFRKVVDALAGFLKTVLVGAFKVVGAVIRWLIDHWRGLLDAFLLGAGPIGWIAMWAIHHFDKVKKALGAAWDWMKGKWDWLWGVFKKTPYYKVMSGMVDAARRVAREVADHWNGIKRTVATVINAIGGFINKAFGWTGIHVPTVSWGTNSSGTSGGKKHAKGAIVRRPEVALVGEDGPELILPLRKPKRMRELLAQVGIFAGTGDTTTGPPRRGRGVIVRRPEVALIGEDGPELILPLTKPKRMKELLDQVGIHAFAQGGIIGNVKDALTGAWGKVKDVAGAVYSIGGNVSKWLLSRIHLPKMPDFLKNLFPSIIKALAAKVKKALSSFSRTTGADFSGLSGGLKSLVAQMSRRMGWDPTPWLKIIMRESGGSMTATNPTSGAYGIAQGITGPKWYYQHGGNPNTMVGQLTAMANYIRGRYGSPTNAWDFWQSHNWYGGGGSFIARHPELIGVGDRGPERVDITPVGRASQAPVQTINVNVVLPHGTTLIGTAREVGEYIAPFVAGAVDRDARRRMRRR